MTSISSPHELGESITRVTAEGKKLTYELRVIQQPERARACGSGAKSSADRRPVDPPPVVELRVFEGEAKTDITFGYNANFFLYASLELARPIAQPHSRSGPTPSAPPQIPVLTGMPVSGMAYLDRPMEAGYFIFPDLSVRHEGKYKLQFNLYEETKDPKDFDPDEPKRDENTSFVWRLEVKSAPFTVYSAKKFPGLAESTVLSRTVAEQGCRVRIRRDVRMRRRDSKNSGGFEEDYDGFSRKRTGTPEPAYNRVRSMSNASLDRSDQYNSDQSRRPSTVEYASQSSYQNGYPQSSTTSQAGSANSFLAFGPVSAAPQYQQSYGQPSASAPPIQPNQQFQPASANYDQGPLQYRHSISGPSLTTYADRPTYQQYASTTLSSRDQYEQDRRSSAGFTRTATSASHYNHSDAASRNSSSSYGSYPTQKAPTPPVNLAPIKMFPLEPRYENSASPSAPLSASRMAPPLPSPFEAHSARSNSYNTYPTTLQTPSSDAPRSAKRTFDSVFSSSSLSQPLHNGNRPSSAHHNGPSPSGSFDDDDDDDDDGPSIEELKMQYKRADGSSHARALPNLN